MTEIASKKWLDFLGSYGSKQELWEKWLNVTGNGKGALKIIRGAESCQAGSTYQLQLLDNGITCSKFEYECGKTDTKEEKLQMGCVRGDWVETG